LLSLFPIAHFIVPHIYNIIIIIINITVVVVVIRWRTYYLSTLSTYVEFPRHNLSVLPVSCSKAQD